MKNVLYDWDDAHCYTILSNLAAAMRPGSRLLMVEFLQEPHRPHPMVPLIDLQMLTRTDGGRERSVAQFRALLEGCWACTGACAPRTDARGPRSVHGHLIRRAPWCARDDVRAVPVASGEMDLTGVGAFVAQETSDLVDSEGGDEPVSQTSFDEAVTQYLESMRATV